MSKAAFGVLAVAAILALLYLGQPILVPVTLAVVLSFSISPLVRRLRWIGFGHVTSVLAAVAASGLVVTMLAGIIGMQAIQLAANFPTYQSTVRSNLKALRMETIGRLEPTLEEAARILDPFADEPADSPAGSGLAVSPVKPTSAAVPVEIRQPKATATQLVERFLALAWGPIGSASVVVVVLIFVLLEQEALRDRFIRLVGGSDLRATTSAINDAGERLSRYLVRQVLVNSAVGLVVWVVLTLIGLPNAPLVAVLTTVLRFVPFLGVPIAALFAAVLSLAAEPGWMMLLSTLVTFAVVEVVTAQVIEPRLYGHATGLSPLSIVLATLFWGWLWGPVGVIIATPLTLCLAVAGRHARSLGFLDVVLGDGPALSLPQKFYQRALSGDAVEIINDARLFLKQKPLAAYCDTVIMPALQLGRADRVSGQITQRQQVELRDTIVRVVEGLAGASRRQLFERSRRTTVLEEASPGRLLRSRRMQREREAALRAASRGEVRRAGSLVLCIGVGGLGDDLATELLVRILGELHLDARHLTLEDLEASRKRDVDFGEISAICIVSVAPGEEREQGEGIAHEIRATLPEAFLVALLLPSILADADKSNFAEVVDRLANSFGDVALEVAEHASGRIATTPGDGDLSRDAE